MDKKRLSELSKLMAYILRHDEKNEYHVDIDDYCYAEIDQLVEAIASIDKWKWVTRNHIEEVAAHSAYRGKKRFEIKKDMIKATYNITRKCPSSSKPTRLTPTPPLLINENEYYVIISKHSGKCLDMSGMSIEEGANVIQYEYWGGGNQQWRLEPVGDGYYRIIAKQSGKCLDVGGMSKDNGANIIQWHYWGGLNQQWRLEPVGDGYYRIIAKQSGKCLDVGGMSKDNGANIIQWHYWGGLNQQWKLELASELDARTARVWSRKGYSLAKSGQYEAAITNFDKALEINPKYTRVWRNKGYALNNLKRCEEAIACFDQALAIDPTSARAWSQKGYALLNLNKFEEATACFDKALEIDPHCEEARIYRKVVEEELRDLSTIGIKRGYEILPNNDLRFGIRVINNTDYVLIDVETILDYPRTLFSLKNNMVQTLASIPPKGERTAMYILTPLGCIHREKIDATILYKDHTGDKHTVQMRPKEIHCVFPFLKAKPLREGEFAQLANTYECIKEGLSFKGIDISKLGDFVKESCSKSLYLVSEHHVDTANIISLSGESIGEKATYLLAAVILPYEGLTHILLRAYSDKPFGLHGFLNETKSSIEFLMKNVPSAKEIGIIQNIQVINIIESIVQRSIVGGRAEGTGTGSQEGVTIEGSVVQRLEIGLARKCPSCGVDVRATDEFCTKCGTKLE